MKVINRIKKYEDFQDVISDGSFIRNDSFNVYYKNNSLNNTRIGISIPKKSGIAVIRNKMKRQIRAVLAHECAMKSNIDIVLIARKSYDIENFAKVNNDLVDILVKVGLKK